MCKERGESTIRLNQHDDTVLIIWNQKSLKA